jgi:molybdate transport system substrate-binding protein
MRLRNPLFAALTLLLLAPGAQAAPVPARPEILVFAAASLSEVLTDLGHAYEASGGGKVSFNFAGSNDLARQIEAGAPAAVFLSANRAQVERLEKSGKVKHEDTFPLLGNILVVIAPTAPTAPTAPIISRESPAAPLTGARGLLGFERLSLADPAAVPAGVYAKAWLEKEGVWAQLAPKVVPALDVRAALAAVAAGNLPVGIVYATDAASSDKVKVIYRVPAQATPDLRYYAAPLAPASPAATAFLSFLKSPKARATFAKAGFIQP